MQDYIYRFVVIFLFTCTVTRAQEKMELPLLNHDYTLPLDKKGIDSLLILADSLNLKAHLPRQSLLLTQFALASGRQTQTQTTIAKTLQIRGTSYLLLSEYQAALKHYNEAINIYSKVGKDKTYLPFLYSLKSIAYSYLDHYDSAAAIAYHAINILEQNNLNTKGTAITIYNNLSIFWMKMRNKKNALHYLSKVEQWAKDRGDSIALVKTNTIGGYIYYQSNPEDDSAIYFFQSAIDLSKSLHNRDLAVDAIQGIGTIYYNRGLYAKALDCFSEALLMPKGVGGVDAEIGILNKIGQCYFHLKDYKNARKMLLKSEHLSITSEIKNELPEIYKTLSYINDSLGNYTEAYRYLKLSLLHADTSTAYSVLETQKIINELEIKYQTAQKDKILAQRQLDLQQQKTELKEKTFWFSSVSIVFLLLSILFIVVYRNTKQRQKIQQNTINNLLQEQEIGQLKARMEGENKERKRIAQELHDGICNMISAARMHLDNSLKEQPDNNSKEHARGLRLLDEAYEELRLTSHNMFPEKLLKYGLEEALEQYCNKISNPPSLTVYYQALGKSKDILPETALSVYRIVQEAVHNSIKHGKANEIIVQTIFEESGEVSLTIEDNGKGLKKNDGKNTETGIGMDSLQQRLRSLGGTIDIQSQEDIGTTINISFRSQAIPSLH